MLSIRLLNTWLQFCPKYRISGETERTISNSPVGSSALLSPSRLHLIFEGDHFQEDQPMPSLIPRSERGDAGS